MLLNGKDDDGYEADNEAIIENAPADSLLYLTNVPIYAFLYSVLVYRL